MAGSEHDQDAPTQVQPPAADTGARTPWEASRGRRIAVRSLIGLAVIVGLLSMFAVWSRQEVLNTNQWTKTSSALLEDPAVRDQVATYLTDQLYSNVNVQAEIEKQLPPALDRIAPAASAALRNLVDDLAQRALENPTVQSAWADANRAAHEQLVQVIEGGGPLVGTQDGVVTLDLSLLVKRIGERVGLPQSLISQIPPSAGKLTILKSQELKTAQNGAKVLKALAWILGPLALLLLALAVFLATGHRRQTLMSAGLAAVSVGLLVLVARNVVGSGVTNALIDEESLKPAVSAVWSISTDLLKGLAWQAVVLGLALVLAAWIAGPSKAATGLRRRLAPTLRDRPEVAFAGLGALLLILIAWGPTPGFHRPLFILILLIAAPLGLWALQRETLAEFPAGTSGVGSGLSLRARASGFAASLRGSDEPTEATSRVERLERLSSLHQGGALSDAEFAAEKQRLMQDGDGPGA
ncbi:unannotated protein [freshwater metagenome]|uniref:Unannotated protein n=1 Tax=freshwater metagenome TaxID=449393 RepID=A0A6J7IDA6_9ZZZZ|nr:hypothetical protein [Actinomycetota bacterium]